MKALKNSLGLKKEQADNKVKQGQLQVEADSIKHSAAEIYQATFRHNEIILTQNEGRQTEAEVMLTKSKRTMIEICKQMK